MTPPRFWKSSIKPASGSSGATWVRRCPPRRTRSIAALVRNTDTVTPAVKAPFAMVKATDDSSESMPLVATTTSLLVDMIAFSTLGVCFAGRCLQS